MPPLANRLSILTFPQRWDGDRIHLRVLVIPKGDPLEPLVKGPTPADDAPSFATARLALQALTMSGLEGLPSPAAAALVAGFVWLAHDNKIPLDDWGLQWVAAFLALYGGLTMVSNVPFYSFKDINFRRSVPFWALLLIVLAFVLVSFDPPIVLFLLFCAYGLSGYVLWALGKRAKPRP